MKKLIASVSLILISSTVFAQQTLEVGEQSDPPTITVGPTQESIEMIFLHDINNAEGTNNAAGDGDEDAFTSFLPQKTVKIIITNNFDAGFSYFHDQNTNNDGGNANNPPTILGWDFAPLQNVLSQTGEAENVLDAFTRLSQSLEPSGSPTDPDTNPFYTSGSTTGDGVDKDTNYAFLLNTGVFGIGNAGRPFRDQRYSIAQVEIQFSPALSNPIIHFVGLGGIWDATVTTGGISYQFINQATTELELIEVNNQASGVSTVTFNELSGSTYFEADNANKIIRNNSDLPDAVGNSAFTVTGDNTTNSYSSGTANGSVEIQGDNISSLTFNLFIRSANTTEELRQEIAANSDYIIIASEEFGWNGNDTYDAATKFSNPSLSSSVAIPQYNFAEEAFMMSFTTEVEPDEVTLDGGSCYRMMSAPTDGTSYDTLLGPLWTQGVASSDQPSGDPNIWLWPDISGESNTGTAGVDTWAPITETQFTNEIPDGTGFLVSVFTDDVWQTTGSFPKTLSLTGSENAPLTVTNANGMNSNNDGWTLLGNPFKSPIQVADGGGNGLFQGTTTDVNTAVYIWDRNTEAGAGGNDTDGITGSWRTGNATGAGDLTNDAIAPFQGFFVQNTSTGGGSSQVQFRDANKTTGGAFYGKENGSVSQARFEVNGEGLFNSMWLQFTDRGSFERDLNDALELLPFTSDYATLGSKKNDDTLFDIGHFPIPEDEIEIPVSFETTRAGLYTFTASDLDISFGQDLYLVDLNEEKSIRIDENLEYSFTISNAAKVNASLRPCNMESGPQKATTFTANDRFLITTQPKEFGSELPSEVALNQNYPNPFNPTTQITYQLPQQSDVRLQVFDMAGRQVATLVNESVSAGTHSVNFNASSLSSGVYLYKLQAGSTVLTRKLTLIK